MPVQAGLIGRLLVNHSPWKGVAVYRRIMPFLDQGGLRAAARRKRPASGLGEAPGVARRAGTMPVAAGQDRFTRRRTVPCSRRALLARV
jgi:hypothetical protein